MELEDDLYLVLDLPEPVSGKVLDARLKYEPARSSLPAEITITGSSGIGTMRTAQNPELVESCLNRLTETTAPFTSSFVDIRKFPGTEIYWFSVSDQKPFFDLQRDLLTLDIEFNPMAYEFCPHCTIANLEGSDPEEQWEILKLEIPRDTFLLDTLSLYSINQHWNCQLVWRAKLQKNL